MQLRAFTEREIPCPRIEFQLPRGPLDLEIGAGQGLHAIRYCQAHPNRQLLAVEKTTTKFASLQRRSRAHPELTNLHAVHADAVAFVRYFLPDDSLDRVFLLYPNPHPKAKQANLRWHYRPFLSLLLEKMKTGAELTLASNQLWYAAEAKDAFLNTWGLKLIGEGRVDPSHPPRTHFEKKYLLRGEACWNLILRKP